MLKAEPGPGQSPLHSVKTKHMHHPNLSFLPPCTAGESSGQGRGARADATPGLTRPCSHTAAHILAGSVRARMGRVSAETKGHPQGLGQPKPWGREEGEEGPGEGSVTTESL